MSDPATSGNSLATFDEIVAVLTAVDRAEPLPQSVVEHPGQFLLDLYRTWVDNGGQQGAKNRNSIRRMRDVWLGGANEVKSLHPKLIGRIRIAKADARSLVALFLAKWRYAAEHDESTDG